ncbi:L-2-amino-thiazoline-4-carboxylic acid hydrolase [Nonomuraea sp. MCN248]|uniref:L-2-amino-thiazoline-4-carboxylic acid hydrolase n=1 Tax=Nonomuraea corallina TaxID=2989783 RepID=A0ABT4SFX2_9ACTN|nr:L-2-amino-thiazoline-4-carboxylic acid hydrolase [Nonomuraea corallina]MDA0636087.1 L-2-amino-thiazoline-4-carboxylic acid hydrolase [Nonomuraea corallina]
MTAGEITTTGADEGGASSLASLRSFQDYHWLMLKVFHQAVESQHGAAGLAAIARGVREEGVFRGTAMRDQPAAFVTGRDPAALLEHWDSGEWELAAAEGDLTVATEGPAVVLTLPRAPGRAYLTELIGEAAALSALRLYWPELCAGISAGYGAGVVLEADDAAAAPWRLRVTGTDPAQRAPRLGALAADPFRLIEVTRRTTGLLAAMQMYVSRELVRAYDASGEETVRQAAYRFGADRGEAIRDRILALGKPLTMANFGSTDGLQERDPSEAVFVFRERQHISDGAYYLDCTYCPLAEIWSSEGEEGLRLGYLFDSSNHRGLFQGYNPETEVRWTSVKSRGDQVCRFRFTVPGLLTEDDPTPEEFDRLG